MWIIIPIGAIIGGPIGFFVAIAIVLWVHFSDTQDNSQDKSLPNDQSIDEKPKIQLLEPIVSLVCYYCTEGGGWSSEKVSFVKNEFQEYCKNDSDLLLLRNMIKQKHSNVHKLIVSFESLGVDEDGRNTTFVLCVKAIMMNKNDVNASEIVDLAKKIKPEVGLFNKIMSDLFSEENNRSDNNQDDEAEWAKNILGLEGSITEREVMDAFRKKARAYHPDRNPNVTDEVMVFLNQKLDELNTARNILIAYLKDARV